jgi:iron complex outermembrane receptor protein
VACILHGLGEATLGAEATGENGLEALKKLTLEEVSQILVTTPSKEPTKVSQTAAAVFVITSEDIRRSGATSIPEALRVVPGVEVARIDGNKWAIGIRGFGSRLTRSVLVLIDGRTVYTTLFDGTYWEVQDTLMDDVERIEVVRGPGGTIWGPNAVDGIINIITKAAKDTTGLLASAGTGSEERGFGEIRYGGTSGEALSYRVYGKGFSRSAQSHSDGQDFDSWRAGQAGFRVDWTNGGRDTVTVQGDAYRETAGERVQATSYAPPFSQILDGNAFLSGGNVLARWTRVLGADNDLQVQGYYDRTNRDEPNFGETRTTWDVDFLQRLRRTRQQFTWGLGARVSPVEDREFFSGLTFAPANRTDNLLTAFFQDEIALVDQRLSLTVGSKWLHTNFTNFGAQPTARLLWTPTDKQTVWTAFTHALRTPSDVEENFFLSGYIGTAPDGSPFLARFNANPNFVPEQLNGYELGYRNLLRANLYLDVAAFYNHYHDLFSQDLTGPPFVETTPAPTHLLLPAQFGNGLLGITKGVEIAPEWRPTPFLRLRGSYSYLHMDVERAPGSADVGTGPAIEGASPRHQLTGHAAFDFPRSLQLDVDYRYVSALAIQLVPSYSTGNVRLAWRAGPGLAFSVVGQNLFQPSHAEFAGDPGPLVLIDRGVYAKVTWNK